MEPSSKNPNSSNSRIHPIYTFMASHGEYCKMFASKNMFLPVNWLLLHQDLTIIILIFELSWISLCKIYRLIHSYSNISLFIYYLKILFKIIQCFVYILMIAHNVIVSFYLIPSLHQTLIPHPKSQFIKQCNLYVQGFAPRIS